MHGYHYLIYHDEGDEDNCGDVEYLPAIAEALLLIDEREAAFQVKWTAKMGTIVVSSGTGGGVGRSKSTVSTVATTVVEADTKSGKETEAGIGVGLGVGAIETVIAVDATTTTSITTTTSVTTTTTTTTAPSLMHHYALYQGCQGELVFLHPMCSKCLLVAGNDK